MILREINTDRIDNATQSILAKLSMHLFITIDAPEKADDPPAVKVTINEPGFECEPITSAVKAHVEQLLKDGLPVEQITFHPGLK